MQQTLTGMGSSLAAVSEVGKGSSFEFDMPLADSDCESESEADADLFSEPSRCVGSWVCSLCVWGGGVQLGRREAGRRGSAKRGWCTVTVSVTVRVRARRTRTCSVSRGGVFVWGGGRLRGGGGL